MTLKRLNAPTELRHSQILGLGEQRPSLLMTNHDLPDTLDTNDEWIQQRTGIASRGIAGDDETVVSMASDASRKAVAEAGIDPAQIGLTILATCTMPQSIPGGAAQVATAVGASRSGALDANAACAGFCYSLSLASDAIRTGSVDYVVVAAAEKLSALMDWTDRGSAILFGDGGGAVVLGPSDEPGIGPVIFGSDGRLSGLIDMTPANHIRMDGPAVFRWATTAMGEAALRTCEAAGVAPAELAAVVPHQANLRIVDAIARHIGADNAVVARDIVTAGNTSSASIPLALSRLRSEGHVTSGDLALTLAFGAGLTWAGTVIRLP
jgi:3-oxoacyl-[acyl-carrier-protein] synthase-3